MSIYFFSRVPIHSFFLVNTRFLVVLMLLRSLSMRRQKQASNFVSINRVCLKDTPFAFIFFSSIQFSILRQRRHLCFFTNLLDGSPPSSILCLYMYVVLFFLKSFSVCVFYFLYFSMPKKECHFLFPLWHWMMKRQRTLFFLSCLLVFFLKFYFLPSRFFLFALCFSSFFLRRLRQSKAFQTTAIRSGSVTFFLVSWWRHCLRGSRFFTRHKKRKKEKHNTKKRRRMETLVLFSLSFKQGPVEECKKQRGLPWSLQLPAAAVIVIQLVGVLDLLFFVVV